MTALPARFDRIRVPRGGAVFASAAFEKLLLRVRPLQVMMAGLAALVRSPERVVALLARHYLHNKGCTTYLL